MSGPLDWSLVFAGGALGGAVRFGALRLATRWNIHASSGLFLVNAVGCFAAGCAAAAVSQGLAGWSPETSRAFFLGGVLGGLTTMSAVSLECATARKGPERRRVLLETALAIVVAAPLARLGMVVWGAVA